MGQAITIKKHADRNATVVIEVDLDEDDSGDDVILSKAWTILAERISAEKAFADDSQAPSGTDAATDNSGGTTGDSSAEPPGNAAWWNG